jgi:hypothetical protein
VPGNELKLRDVFSSILERRSKNDHRSLFMSPDEVKTPWQPDGHHVHHEMTHNIIFCRPICCANVCFATYHPTVVWQNAAQQISFAANFLLINVDDLSGPTTTAV